MELFSKYRLGLALKDKAARYYRWEYFWLSLIVIAALAIHFAMVMVPNDIVLDEIHYISDARSIMADNGTQRIEHPPLAKLIIVAGMEVFGDNPWGWRVLPILFSTATVIMFYFLCRKLNMSRTASSVATYLLAFENLFYMLSGLAMLDVYCVTFMMAAFLCYVYQRYINTGVAVGLSALAKLNGALAGPVVFLHWLFTRQGRSRWILLTIIFTIVTFFALMPVFNLIITHEFTSLIDPVRATIDMMKLSGSLTFATVDHPCESPPWEWLYTYKPMAFYWLPHYTAAISFSVWALIVPVFGYMIYRYIKKDEAALFGLAWFTATYLVWIPATIITDRVTYIYYFYPTVGAVCLGLGIALGQLLEIFKNRPRGKVKWLCFSAVLLVLVVHLASFLILSPLIPVDFAAWIGITG